jgi:hypothetical protein
MKFVALAVVEMVHVYKVLSACPTTSTPRPGNAFEIFITSSYAVFSCGAACLCRRILTKILSHPVFLVRRGCGVELGVASENDHVSSHTCNLLNQKYSASLQLINVHAHDRFRVLDFTLQTPRQGGGMDNDPILRGETIRHRIGAFLCVWDDRQTKKVLQHTSTLCFHSVCALIAFFYLEKTCTRTTKIGVDSPPSKEK